MGRKRKESREGERSAGPAPVRPFWSGTISFGLINVPVQLFPAARRTAVSLRMLAEDGTPLRRRYWCPADERFVKSDEIVRGYELEDGSHVVVTDEELEAMEPDKSREIDLRRFVDLASVPPLYFDRSYFLTPTGDSNKAYRLLAEVMERTGRAGIATFVMRGKEYLVAILAEGGVLRADTLRFQEELRPAEAIGIEELPEPDLQSVRRFEAAIRGAEEDELDPDELVDDSAARMVALARKKHARGRDVYRPEEAEVGAEPEADPEDGDGEGGIDLLETIRRRLHGGNGASDGRRGGDDLERLPKNRLYERARELEVEGRSTMDRDELIRALRRKR